jgi:hypothetical protein
MVDVSQYSPMFWQGQDIAPDELDEVVVELVVVVEVDVDVVVEDDVDVLEDELAPPPPLDEADVEDDDPPPEPA